MKAKVAEALAQPFIRVWEDLPRDIQEALFEAVVHNDSDEAFREQLAQSPSPSAHRPLAHVPFNRYFQVAAFNGEATAAMGTAFEHAMTSACIANRNDPLAELIAHKIMQLYRLGEHDPAVLSDRALNELGVRLSMTPENNRND